jgi:hypothetical protein
MKVKPVTPVCLAKPGMLVYFASPESRQKLFLPRFADAVKRHVNHKKPQFNCSASRGKYQ